MFETLNLVSPDDPTSPVIDNRPDKERYEGLESVDKQTRERKGGFLWQGPSWLGELSRVIWLAAEGPDAELEPMEGIHGQWPFHCQRPYCPVL